MSVHFRDPPAAASLASRSPQAGDATASESPPDRAVEEALSRAAERFREAGRSWSVYCRRILEILLRARAPVRAYALMEPLKAEGRRVYPPTVYRALAALEEVGLVHRVASLNAFAACTAAGAGAPHAPAFMICDDCGAVGETPIDVGRDAVVPVGEGFQTRSVVLELHGLCRRCGPAEAG
jgi:Fur family zinc uptake transcriptional regulator